MARGSQRNRGKGPCPWVIAILDRTPFKATTGVAEDNDASHLLRKNRCWRPGDSEVRRGGRRSRLADYHREIGFRGGALPHG